MTTARRLTLLALLLASAALLVAYGRAELWPAGLVALLPGAVWLAGLRRGWAWSPSLGFVTYTALSAGVALRAAAPWLALFSLLAALTAWDLTAWQTRLAGARLEETPGLLAGHLRRLLAVLLLSGLLFALSRFVDLRLSLWSAIFLGILLLLALYQTTRLLRQSDR